MWTERLLIPGPTAVPAAVLAAQARQMTNHRGERFSSLRRQVEEGLVALGDAERAVVLAASGTGGLEAAAQNLLPPGARVLAVAGGAFGERFARVAERSGARVDRLEVAWGAAVRPEDVVAGLQRAAYDAVLLTQSETSTGVLHPVEEVAAALAGGPLLIVDAISGFPSVPLRLRESGIDAAITCSQKGFMAPPGLAMLLLGPRALAVAGGDHPRPVYFDLRPYLAGELPFTPAVSLWYALAESLELLAAEGEEARAARHRLLSRMARGAGEALGLPPLADAASASPTVTALTVPDALAEPLRRSARALGAVFAGGQGQLAGRIVRVGHVGDMLPGDLVGGIAAMEVALAGVSGRPADGRAVAAALTTWALHA